MTAQYNKVRGRKRATTAIIVVSRFYRIGAFPKCVSGRIRAIIRVRWANAAVILVALHLDAGSEIIYSHSFLGIGHARLQDAGENIICRKPVATTIDDDTEIYHVNTACILNNHVLIGFESRLLAHEFAVCFRVVDCIEAIQCATHLDSVCVLVAGYVFHILLRCLRERCWHCFGYFPITLVMARVKQIRKRKQNQRHKDINLRSKNHPLSSSITEFCHTYGMILMDSILAPGVVDAPFALRILDN